MLDEDSWGPWIEHHGKGQPPEVVGRLLRIEAEQFNSGELLQVERVEPRALGCNGWDWSYFGAQCHCRRRTISRYVRYRVHEPKAMETLKALLEASLPSDMPVEVTEDA